MKYIIIIILTCLSLLQYGCSREDKPKVLKRPANTGDAIIPIAVRVLLRDNLGADDELYNSGNTYCRLAFAEIKKFLEDSEANADNLWTDRKVRFQYVNWPQFALQEEFTQDCVKELLDDRIETKFVRDRLRVIVDDTTNSLPEIYFNFIQSK